MIHKQNKENFNYSVNKFVQYRKNISKEDKKLEAGLLIEQIHSVKVENALNDVRKRIGKSKIQLGSWIIRAAAVFSIPLLAFTIWSLFSMYNETELSVEQVSWQEIECPSGMRSHIVLPDGTDLWLNSGSNIRYGIPFVRETRQIDLTGEAFLHVTKNSQSPFIVNSGNIQIKVLGTKFNVKAYPEDNQIEVALKEGSIEFYYEKSDNKKVFTELQPNNFLIYNLKDGNVKIEDKELDKYIGWYQNILIFDDTPMMEVARVLERWYGVKVVIGSEEIKKYKFTTTFENEPLARVLELLELSSPLSVKYSPGRINKKSNTITKSVVTITKR